MAQNRKVQGAGFQLIIRTGSVTEAVQKAVMKGLTDVGKQYKERVMKNISLDDHTLQELREMGHPYRVTGPKDALHGDDRLVHEQSGKLKSSIRLQPVEQTTSRKFTVYITSNAPEMPFLIYGTSRMRPRRFHEKSYEDIKDRFWKPLLSELKKVNVRIAGYES